MKNIDKATALLLAASVKKIFPDCLLGEYRDTDDGFYYDFLFKNNISEAEFGRIERQMIRYIKGGYKWVISKSDSLKGEKYKEIILKENKEIVFFDFINPSNKKIEYSDFLIEKQSGVLKNTKNFKLLSIGGSYWKGDAKNTQFTRIHAVSREDKVKLDSYLKLLDVRKFSDHRIINKSMNLFSFNLLSGQGFPNWLEDGMHLKNTIKHYIKNMDNKYGFKEVSTSIVGDKKLYETSGHLEHYADTMFPIMKVHGEELILRPMTCPHHILLYQAKPKSYNEFPIRYSEQSQLYRYEKSGSLTGLERVRSMELTEGHIFARKDQIKSEMFHCYEMIQEVLKKFNIEIHSLLLSLRDPSDKEKFFDDDKMWNEAESDLKEVVQELGIKYIEEVGEAAFYGPKIDFQVLTSLKKEITMSTLQLDFLLPKRFEINYQNKDKTIDTPILIHRGLIGTYERFIAILLEQTKGDLPFWLQPKQIIVIPINNSKHLEYAQNIYEKLKQHKFRISINKSNDRLGKKIRDAQKAKNKYQIIIGDAEVSKKIITIRKYGDRQSKTLLLTDFIETLLEKI